MSTRSGDRQILSHPAVLRELTVTEVQDLGPHARRAVLSGEQLGAFSRNGLSLPPFESPGPEDHVKLVLPAAATEPVVLPEQLDGKLVWPTEPEPIRRDVSVRNFDAANNALCIEVVRHGGGGPLASWIDRIVPGDTVHLSGPRSSRLMPPASHFVLVGDLASLAAVARWTFTTPPAAAVTARVAVPEPADERPITRPGDAPVDVEWFHAAPEEVLLDALAKVDLGDDPFVFVGAENDIAKDARTFLRAERGLNAKQFRCIGYWRREA